MSRRKLLIVIIVFAVAGAALSVWALGPRVDRLTMAMRIGISAGPATPEAEQLYRDWWDLLEISNKVAAVAFLLLIFSGPPLALFVIVANWSTAVARLVRSKAAMRACLTLQAVNLGFAVILMLFAVADPFDELPLTMTLIGVVYVLVNSLAVREWRGRLLQADAGK